MERRPNHVHEQRAKVGDSSVPLPVAVKRLLPTPNAWDGERGANFASSGPGGVGRGRPDDGAGQARWGEYEPAIRRSEAVFGRAAPQPSFVEWMMGAPEGWS